MNKVDLLMSILEDLAFSILDLSEQDHQDQQTDPVPGLWSDEYIEQQMEQEPPSRYVN